MSNANIFNVNHAKTLIDDPHAALKIVTCKRRITLLPCYVNNLKKGIIDVLNSELRRYSERLDGLLIAYENLHLIDKFGVAAFDEPSIHVEIQGDFIVFQPVIGCILKGIVNKKAKNHVSCLVHQVFNASLPRPPADETWLGYELQVGDEILFKVSHLDLSSRVIFIRGFILSISSKCNQSNGQEMLVNGDKHYDESDNFVTTPSRLIKGLEINPQHNMNMSESSSEDNISGDLEEQSSKSSLKRKKSQKEKTEKSSSSKEKSEKKAKKRKRSLDDNSTILPPKKKRKESKKKKKKKEKEDRKHKKKKKHKQKSNKEKSAQQK